MSSACRLLAALLAPAILGLTLVASPALAEAPPAAELHPFNGAWERFAVEEDEADRASAIEAAIAGLSWLTRKMAGPILRSGTTPPARYEFIVTEPDLLLGQRGEEPRPLPLDGRQHAGKGPRGEFTAHSRLVDGVIETDWVFTDARGRNRYTITDGGATLIVQHEIEITGLSGVEPIQYQSRFQRTASVNAGPPQDAD